jgi:hypothetical protein
MINISIVLYKHSPESLAPLIDSILKIKKLGTLYLVDNSPLPCGEFNIPKVQYLFTGTNRGYGAGHNIALRKSLKAGISYHLVLNPDIEIKAQVVEELLEYMENNPDTGQLMPSVVYPDGSRQFLCKLLPAPSDLLFRRFLPTAWTRKRMHHFEMRATGYSQVMEVPYLSGCFMLLRTSALTVTGLFDERFFMYPEDIDLTRRIHRNYKTIFYPFVTVVHHHEQSSYTNVRMLLIHIVNLIRYFNKWGWYFDSEREQINKRIIQLYNL